MKVNPPAPPPPPPSSANTVPITNKSGIAQINYPLQIGRPFVCGEIAHYPQIVVNGVPASTQADVKNRCPDGSVKFAVDPAVIPSLPTNGNVVLNFQDQPAGNNAPISAADLLAQFPDFNAVIRMTNPGPRKRPKSRPARCSPMARANCGLQARWRRR